MRNFTTQATLLMALPDGMTDQEAFQVLNKLVNPFGVDFIWPAYPGVDKPAVFVRVLREEKPRDARELL